jgi:hypothetical protein
MFSRLVLHKTSKDSLTNGDSIAYFWTVMRVLSQESKLKSLLLTSVVNRTNDDGRAFVARCQEKNNLTQKGLTIFRRTMLGKKSLSLEFSRSRITDFESHYLGIILVAHYFLI